MEYRTLHVRVFPDAIECSLDSDAVGDLEDLINDVLLGV